MKVFTDSTSPNKQVVMKELYYTASKDIHHVSAVILPSKYPFRPLRRLFRFGIVGKNNQIYGYETNRDVALGWCISEGKTSIYETEKRLIAAGYPFSIKKGHANFRCESVLNCQVTPFMDLDFCSNWTCKRDVEKSIGMKESASYIFINKIKAQADAFPEQQKALLGTVSLWGTPKSKEVSFTILSELVNIASYGRGKLYSIDCDTIGYGVGTKISKDGFHHKNGGTYHAYEHDVELQNATNVKLRIFTYNDGCPMLSFVILYK